MNCKECGSHIGTGYESPDMDICYFCFEGYKWESDRQDAWEKQMTDLADRGLTPDEITSLGEPRTLSKHEEAYWASNIPF